MSLKRLLYTLFLYLVFPLVLLRLLWRSRANSDYRKRWNERLGFIKNINQENRNQQVIWVHAVSVGEVIAAKPLIEALLDTYKSDHLLITTTTPTGSDRVNSIFANQIKQQRLIHVYFPYDLIGSVFRFVNRINPKILIVVETEIWPNLYSYCYKKNIPILMVNARLSEKSTQSYLRIKSLVAETLANVSTIAVRSNSDGKRFIQLGANLNQIHEVGNIKYDISIDDEQVAASKKYLKKWINSSEKNHFVYVAASTHKGEDSKILFTYLNLLKRFPGLLLVLVPRHPERFDEVYQGYLEELPENIGLIRHSDYLKISSIPKMQKYNVILGDSMGEMQMWYAMADVVFIGGSLVKTGGHNPLEATVFGVPVVSGPHMFNFEDIVTELNSAGLLNVCEDEFEIIKYINSILSDKDDVELSANSYLEKANNFMQQHRGVNARLLSIVSQLLKK